MEWRRRAICKEETSKCGCVNTVEAGKSPQATTDKADKREDHLAKGVPALDLASKSR